MAGPMSGPNMPKAGLRATIRFQWKNERDPWMPREVFGRAVLLAALKLKVEEVYCLQTNSQEKCYDVTFFNQDVCNRALEDSKRLAGVRPLINFDVVTLDKPNFRIITIHIYNPYITDEAVAGFMARYVELLAGPRRINDVVGFWTGKRQYQVLLKPDPAGVDGWAHPPAFFNIGADRGYLFYSRQPLFCRRCRCQGHTEQNCSTRRCRVCQAEGHEARDCPVPKTCYICGAQGHLSRDCGRRGRTYAATAERKREQAGPSGQAETVAREEPQTDGSGDGVLRLLEDVIEELKGKDVGEVASSALGGPSPQKDEERPVGEEMSLEAALSGVDGQSMSDEPAEFGAGKSKRKKKRKELIQAKVLRGGELGEGGVGSKRVKGAAMGGVGQGMGGVEEIVQMGAKGGLEGEGNDMVGGGVGPVGLNGPFGRGEEVSLEGQDGVGVVAQEAVLSPRGPDAYEGPLRPSLIPNEMPFSWAELSPGSQMDTGGLYGD